MRRIHAPLSVGVLADLAIMAFATLIVILSGIAILLLLVGTVVVGVLLLSGGPFAYMGDEDWSYRAALLVWIPLALCGAIHNTVVGLEVMNDPTPRGGTRLLLASVLIVATFPALWFG